MKDLSDVLYYQLHKAKSYERYNASSRHGAMRDHDAGVTSYRILHLKAVREDVGYRDAYSSKMFRSLNVFRFAQRVTGRAVREGVVYRDASASYFRCWICVIILLRFLSI